MSSFAQAFVEARENCVERPDESAIDVHRSVGNAMDEANRRLITVPT
jgi:hypothetical protein